MEGMGKVGLKCYMEKRKYYGEEERELAEGTES